MKFINKIKKLPVVLIFIIIIVAIVLLINLIIFLSKVFVYLGFNLFLYLDNLLKFEAVNPMVMWGILGLFFGSIVGVVLAIKKYRLPKKLIIYPISAALLLIIIFSFINKPTNLSGSFTIANPAESTVNIPTHNTTPVYSVIQDINVRSAPSVKSTKLFTLSQGSQVQILESTTIKNSRWSKIQYNNPQTGYTQTGYINSKYLRYY